MKIQPLRIPDCHLLHATSRRDARGFFARVFDADALRGHGLQATIKQMSLSHNRRRGTLRGLHYQARPHAEVKIVQCVRGAAYDVLLDLRRDSPAFLHWSAVRLDATTPRALYVPKGVAHGFLTLDDDTDLHYSMMQPHVPDAARGVRWNDPAFGIRWPARPRLISERDQAYPDYER